MALVGRTAARLEVEGWEMPAQAGGSAVGMRTPWARADGQQCGGPRSECPGGVGRAQGLRDAMRK